ncbi:MAG: ATP-binding cassette domain-containing protein [Bdellovibrionales bacterium]|nr:ATP-binding cassette domain-containing protein [Bdellovibrionales bacterium]
MALIEIKNFKKSFQGHDVHKDINLSIFSGECLGIIGGSGVGKSVLLKSLIGLIKPDDGQVLFKNQDITKLNEDELVEVRKKIAYVFQNGALFDSLSVYENLAYPLKEHTMMTEQDIYQKIYKTLDEFGVLNAINKYPAELSGGMQKRVGLARSIIMDPEVILYDEPTAGLDPYNTKIIQETIIKLKNKNVTSIFVTHDMPSAFAVCDRIAFLNQGVVAAVSDVKEITNNNDNEISAFAKGLRP